MIIMKNKLKIAVVQAAPIMFDKEKCKEKAIRIIKECAEHGAEFVVFPELFIPGYPYGMTYDLLSVVEILMGEKTGNAIMTTQFFPMALK